LLSTVKVWRDWSRPADQQRQAWRSLVGPVPLLDKIN
jgi:hypothetical protein